MTTLVLVSGTWGGPWTTDGSPFRQFVEARGFVCQRFLGWSEDVDGIPEIAFRKGEKNSDWIHGGYALSYFLRSLPYEDRNVIAHSHGGQVAAYCAALAGLPIRRLVTVCTPVRSDMAPIYEAAAPLIGHWRHVSAAGWDFWQRAGELADGHFGWQRKMAYAHENLLIPNIGHSKLLHDPSLIPLLEQDGILDCLREVGHEEAAV